MAKVLKKFNVLKFDFSCKHKKVYDVLPYFRNCWKNKKYDKKGKDSIKNAKQESKRKQLLKDWIKSKSQYMYWSRCEYEYLMGAWPFGSYKMKEKMKEFLKRDNINLDDYSQNIDFTNIIISDMEKIDIHEQIMMNIDIITDILFEEFKLNKKRRIKHEQDISN